MKNIGRSCDVCCSWEQQHEIEGKTGPVIEGIPIEIHRETIGTLSPPCALIRDKRLCSDRETKDGHS